MENLEQKEYFNKNAEYGSRTLQELSEDLFKHIANIFMFDYETLENVVKNIELNKDYDDDCHSLEDSLMLNLLHCLSKDKLTLEQAKKYSEIILKIEDIEFSRWYC